MKRNTVFVAAGLAAAVLLAAAFLLLRPGQGSGTVARITLDGEVVRELDLSQITEAVTFTVTGKSGLSNTITAENGEIWVEKADCPDQICVHQGAIHDDTAPIVCLPNQLIIEIVGGGSSLDAAAG